MDRRGFFGRMLGAAAAAVGMPALAAKPDARRVWARGLFGTAARAKPITSSNQLLRMTPVSGNSALTANEESITVLERGVWRRVP